MKPSHKTVRSPRGLLTNTHETRQIASDLRETAPGRYTFKAPDSRRELQNLITFWYRWAREMIEAEGKDPADYRKLARGDVLDRSCAAARLLVRLASLRAYCLQIDRGGSPWGALTQALLVASYVHQLTLVDNEPSIDGTLRRKIGGAEAGKKNRKVTPEKRDDILRRWSSRTAGKVETYKQIARMTRLHWRTVSGVVRSKK
jgi:hypothetical protein